MTLNPRLQYAYLVPRKKDRSSPLECCLEIGYRGLIKLATQEGRIKYVTADVVRDGDEFVYNGKTTPPVHTFNPFEPVRESKKIVGAYCVAHLPDGNCMVETMTRSEIAAVQKCSSNQSGFSPWKIWSSEMIKKTVIRRAYKLWPYAQVESKLDYAIGLMNENDGVASEKTNAEKASDLLALDNNKNIETESDNNNEENALNNNSHDGGDNNN